ncbi:MAG: hypothetical protein WKF90_10985 [Pyrinomonadaceae bacterium]
MLNENEIKEMNQVLQAVADTSEFHKWQDLRRTAGLSMDHESWEQARDSALWRQKAHAESGKRQRTANLEAERLTAQAKMDAEIELELASDKKRLQNQWLADNPNKTEADFNRQAWHLLKENLIAERADVQMEVEMRAVRASMDYF